MNFRTSGCLRLIIFCIAAAMLVVGCAKQDDAASKAEKTDKKAGVAAPGIAETNAIAEEGYIYGLPIVMNYLSTYKSAIDRKSGLFVAPFNEIKNYTYVYTYKDRTTGPNRDVAFSTLQMDLRAEPIVLSVPAVEKNRYYSVLLVDDNSFNYGHIGSRATGSGAGDYMIAGPDWKGDAPPSIKNVFRSPTQFSLARYRTQFFNPEDMSNVVKVQSGYTVQPLSAYLKQPAPPAAPALNFPKIDNELFNTNFFEYLDFALQFAPPWPEDREIRAKLASIGIGPGKRLDFNDLSLEHKAAVGLGMKAGDKKVTKAAANLGKDINGWIVDNSFGDRAFYHGDWLLRAAARKTYIAIPDAAEYTYARTTRLANGARLDAGKHNYTLTFAKEQYPPVNAFWSVTMYDGGTQRLIENPIDRYLINSPMLPNLKKNADGSLTLYIQANSPGKARESNWLPAPRGPIYLVMRLYWPKTEPPSILPPGEGTWRPPMIKVAK